MAKGGNGQGKKPRAGGGRVKGPKRVRKSVAPPARQAEVPTIGVGASAGGIDALKELLSGVPPDSGASFVVVQHLDPTHESQMATVLATHTALRVRQAEDGMAIAPNTVYTIPPGCYLGLKGGRLQLLPQDPERAPRMSIDFLFRSLASELQEKAIAVILSGSGADGTLGVRAVRGAGGLAVAQDPDTAQFDSMPRSAIATGLVDYVLPPAAIAPAVLDYVRHSYSRAAVEEEPSGPAAEGLDEILLLLLRANADFRGYKPSTLLRRVRRRMGVNRIATLSDYAQFLRSRPDEVAKLAKDVLISVTAFFRDPEAYEELRAQAMAPLVRELPEDQPVRAWVAGAATGEEAYSIAILLLEELQAAGKINPLQIFASDLDEEALAFARAGVYPESIAVDVSPERLARFFTKQDHSYRVNRDIRDAIVFSGHNMITDPPFTRMDLVSCRNVLIYLGTSLQQRLLSLLSFALRTGGYLFLGSAESLSGDTEVFEPVSKKWRIFRRTPVPRHDIADFPMVPRPPVPAYLPPAQQRLPPAGAMALAQRALVEHFAAALVVIDGRGNLLYFQGDTDKYLRHPTGGPDLNLFTMAREKLPRRLRAAVRQALASEEPVRIEQASLGADGGAFVTVTVEPVGDSLAPERLLAVIFEDVQEAAALHRAAPATADLDEASAMVEQLEVELRGTREELRLTATEHAAAVEELKASHEEAVSMNEELRSTNEELETSKEELQSVNEELTTLNAELQNKIRALNEVNSDLANLLEATDVATLFVDGELRVRRFTPSATQVLNLIPADVGRPVSHISPRFESGDLAGRAEQVLRDLTPAESEVRTPEGRWYLMRVLPYRDASNRVDGVVVTFVNVTPLRLARRYAESIVATVREPLLVLGTDLRVVSANPAFYRAFQASPEETEGRRLLDLGEGQWNAPELRERLAAVTSGGPEFQEFEVEQDSSESGRRVLALSARRIEEEAGRPALVLLAMEDVTARRRALQLAEAMISEVSHRTKNGLAIVAAMLQMQVDHQVTDEASRSLLRDAITRIRAFAALYEQVQRGQTERIEVVSALRQIAETVRTTIATRPAEVTVEGEPMSYPFQASTNLVVVANELITNALKHGAADATGIQRVRVAVGREDGEFTLSVWNSGNPVPPDFGVPLTTATGLYLVQTVVSDYYNGEFRLEPYDGGTCATIVLPEERLQREP